MAKQKSELTKKKVVSKRLISLSEFRNDNPGKISPVLEAGFRMWMKVDKQEPLRARTDAEWQKLLSEYLKS